MRTQTEIDDRDHLVDLRYKATYQGYKNSLVEWTISDEWLDVDGALPNPHRGVTFDGKTYVFGTTFSGEIECK